VYRYPADFGAEGQSASLGGTMLDSLTQWLVINNVLATWAAVFAAVISAFVAVIVSVVNAVIQLSVASTKLKVDRSTELIDEFFSDAIYEARLKIDKALRSSSGSDIDLFCASLNPANRKNLAHLMHYFEKLEGMVASKQVDKNLLEKTMSNKIAWWLIYLIERFGYSMSSEWYPLLVKLKKLRGLCTHEDYHRYKGRSFAAVAAKR
jgi:hypothetical protein